MTEDINHETPGDSHSTTSYGTEIGPEQKSLGQARAEIINALDSRSKILSEERDSNLHPEVQDAIKRFPSLKDEIIDVVQLYCDPRLHNCEFEDGNVYYVDPESGERKQLKRLSETSQHRGGGSQRVVFEGPTEDTVIKLVPTGFGTQSDEELGCYLEATPDERDKLVQILGFRKVHIGRKEDSLVLLEEKVDPINIGDRRVDEQDLVRDIQNLKRDPEYYTPDIQKRYGLTSLEQLKELHETVRWGKQYGLQDPNMSNVGLNKEGHFVYHDFGARKKLSRLSFLFSKSSDIDFEKIRNDKL